MHGWRARIGVMIPSVNTVLEPDFYAMAPPGVSIHASRLLRGPLMTPSMEDEYGMAAQLERAAAELASARVDVLLYGCTGGSLLDGAGYDEQLARRIREATGIAATTTSTAVLQALRALDIRRVSILTPYPEWIDLRERRFLEASGLTVLDMKGLGLDFAASASASREQIYRAARGLKLDGADGLFISCTNFPAVACIEALERDTGLPVVTSNQASLWAVLRILGLGDALTGCGRLLSGGGHLAPEAPGGGVPPDPDRGRSTRQPVRSGKPANPSP
jgi:maleate isomerase